MNPISLLMQTLYQVVGNKRYMRDLERLLNDKLTDLDEFDAETLRMLARSLRELNNG